MRVLTGLLSNIIRLASFYWKTQTTPRERERQISEDVVGESLGITLERDSGVEEVEFQIYNCMLNPENNTVLVQCRLRNYTLPEPIESFQEDFEHIYLREFYSNSTELANPQVLERELYLFGQADIRLDIIVNGTRASLIRHAVWRMEHVLSVYHGEFFQSLKEYFEENRMAIETEEHDWFSVGLQIRDSLPEGMNEIQASLYADDYFDWKLGQQSMGQDELVA